MAEVTPDTFEINDPNDNKFSPGELDDTFEYLVQEHQESAGKDFDPYLVLGDKYVKPLQNDEIPTEDRLLVLEGLLTKVTNSDNGGLTAQQSWLLTSLGYVATSDSRYKDWFIKGADGRPLASPVEQSSVTNKRPSMTRMNLLCMKVGMPQPIF